MKMKKKHPKIDLDNFALVSDDPDDESLPAPRGKAPTKKTPNWEEQAKLQRTRDFGGLVPERSPILDRLCRLLCERELKK
jgi:hypothetical protein